MVASHNDADHIGGLIYVLNSNIPVNAVIYNGEASTSTTYQDFLNAMMARRITLTPASVGQQYSRGQISGKVLNPQTTQVGLQNEDSVALRLSYGDNPFLFTGNIGTGTEYNIEWINYNEATVFFSALVKGVPNENQTHIHLNSCPLAGSC